MSDPLVNALGPLDGAEIPGGCAECNAVQKVRFVSAGVWVLDVLHEDHCPAMNRMGEDQK